MQEVINKEIIIKEYPIIGADCMVKKYGSNRRYYIRRASILGVKFQKKRIRYCSKCNKQIGSYHSSNLCGSCSSKAKYKLRGAFSSGNIFSIPEISYLKENFYSLTKDELCKSLNRSWNSITHKAHRLGLKRNPFFLEEGNRKGMNYFISNNPMKKEEYKLKAMNKQKVIFSRTRMTCIEKAVAEFLNSINVPYEFNKMVRTSKTFRFPDFTIGKLIIECNGRYWHKDKEELDRLRQIELEELGFKVINFDDDEILNNFEEVKRCIIENIQQ